MNPNNPDTGDSRNGKVWLRDLIDTLFILQKQQQRPPPLRHGHFCDTVYICICLWHLYWTILPSLFFSHMHSRLVCNVKGISITSLYFHQQCDRHTDTYTRAYNYTSIHNLKTIMSIYTHTCACTFRYVSTCVLVCVFCKKKCLGLQHRAIFILPLLVQS